MLLALIQKSDLLSTEVFIIAEPQLLGCGFTARMYSRGPSGARLDSLDR